MAKTNNVFISHYSKDDDAVQTLKTRLNNAGYGVRNFSVDSSKHKDGTRPSDAVIARLLRRQISWSGTFICLIGDKTHTRKWVNFEIRNAYLQGKRIVGVFRHGSKESAELPEAFKKYGGPTIGWNAIDRLGQIIKEKDFPTQDADGNPVKGYHQIVSIKCSA